MPVAYPMPEAVPISPVPSFDALARTHAVDLYRYAYWLARDRHQAEDAVQEALLRGWRAYPTLREGAAAKSWLFSIVRNEFYRQRAREAPLADAIDVESIDLGIECSELKALEMRDVLHALPVGFAEPLALQILGGFSCAEIASMLATTEGAIMTRLTRARQALRRAFDTPSARSAVGGRA
jgi:RNA polymerase sigma-70 factor, ECF subfamily